MVEVNQAFQDVKQLYSKLLGHPAPEIPPDAYASFPPGVDPLKHALQEVDYLKELSERMAATPDPVSWVPTADTFVAPDAFVVRMEIPGVDREGLKVLLLGGECVVRGERKQTDDPAEMRPLTVERNWGPFERRFMLPAGSHPDKITARFREGVLEVRVPVAAAAKPKEMNVETA